MRLANIDMGHDPIAEMWDSRATSRMVNDVDIYVRDGVYNGVKVDSGLLNRMIPKDTDLSEVFRPVSDVSVYCLNVFPGSPDIEVYQDILNQVYSGDAFIDSIDKHPTDNGFVVMLVVNKAKMVFRKDTYNEIYPPMDVKNGTNN